MQRSEPHWLLNDADAQRYGAALANALRHMPIKAAQKTIDYATLVMVAFVMETPRVVRSIQLSRQPKQPPRGPAQVFQFVNPNAPQTPNAAHPPGAPTSPPPPPTGAAEAQAVGPMPPIADGPPDLSSFGGEGA